MSERIWYTMLALYVVVSLFVYAMTFLSMLAP
jgi:hypothetical protein